MKPFLFFFLLITLLTIACKKNSDLVTPPVPVDSDTLKVTTDPIKDLTVFSATLGGQLVDSGKSFVTELGFVADTVQYPTITKNVSKFICIQDANGKFHLLVTDIPGDRKWYIRAYGINKEGVKYGNEVQFSSLHDNVYFGDVNLTTQQEVVDFGANNYTRIRGSLNLNGPVNDLSPLNNLVIIANGFDVINTSLTDFKGLEKLEMIGDEFSHRFQVQNNSLLKHFTGLNKLSAVAGYVAIINNDALEDLAGWEAFNLAYSFEFRIDDCDNITTIHGLENMVGLAGDIMLRNNLRLNDLTPWKKLMQVTGRLYVINCSALQKLDGLEGITTLDGVDLTDNPMLQDINGLKNLTTVASLLNIDNNDALTDMSAFKNLRSVQALNVKNNGSLTNFNGFNNLGSIEYRLTVDNNAALVNFQGLERLKWTPTLEITRNASLEDFKGLDSLASLTGSAYSISAVYNDKMTSLSGLEHLKKADGQIYISFNPLLTDFCSLKTLFTTGYTADFITEGNSSNPTSSDITTNCP